MDREYSKRYELCDEAESAMDALIEAEWDISRVPVEDRHCAEKLMSFLETACDPTEMAVADITESTLRRMLSVAPAEAKLTDESADVLDMWSTAGYSSAGVPKKYREHAERHDSMVGLIERYVQADGLDATQSLVDRTLAHVQSYEPAESQRDWTMTLRVRLPDIASIAAMLLIGVSVMMPVLASMRHESMRRTNESNFAVASVGFGSYASDHAGQLPVYTPTHEMLSRAHQATRRWWMVGLDPMQSNSANLYTLSRLGYASLESLASPGNKHAVSQASDEDAVDWGSFEQVSYSYRVEKSDTVRSPWAGRGLVVMTDRSPVTLKAYQNLPIDPFENSPNHSGRGQHILHGDGSVDWLTTPWLAYNDHVFLPRFIERLINPDVRQTGMMPIQGLERPESNTDAFVGP